MLTLMTQKYNPFLLLVIFIKKYQNTNLIQAQDLLKKMLFKFPDRRPSMKECLNHYFFTEAFQVPKSPILKFSRKAVRQMSV